MAKKPTIQSIFGDINFAQLVMDTLSVMSSNKPDGYFTTSDIAFTLLDKRKPAFNDAEYKLISSRVSTVLANKKNYSGLRKTDKSIQSTLTNDRCKGRSGNGWRIGVGKITHVVNSDDFAEDKKLQEAHENGEAGISFDSFKSGLEGLKTHQLMELQVEIVSIVEGRYNELLGSNSSMRQILGAAADAAKSHS